MSDPALALQGWHVAALKESAALAAIVAGRVYDDVPKDAPFPYVSIGEGHSIGEDLECGDATEIFAQVHAWSRTPGFPECKRMTAAIRDALKATPSMEGFDVSVVQYVQTRHLRDPDGKTSHGVVEFRYLVTHTS